MNQNKQLAFNLIAGIVAFVINMGISFFLTPFIVKNVGSEAFGFVGVANDFINYAQIMTFALNSMAGRFITISLHQEKFNDLNQYYTSIFIANLLISGILMIPFVFTFLFFDKIVNVPIHILTDVRLLFRFLFLASYLVLMALFLVLQHFR